MSTCESGISPPQHPKKYDYWKIFHLRILNKKFFWSKKSELLTCPANSDIYLFILPVAVNRLLLKKYGENLIWKLDCQHLYYILIFYKCSFTHIYYTQERSLPENEPLYKYWFSAALNLLLRLYSSRQCTAIFFN